MTKAVRSGRPALIVRWTRHNINERVTGYQVQYRRGTSGEWRGKRVSSVSTSTYLENLDIGTSYQVRVNALSDIGDGSVGDIRVQPTYNGMVNYCVNIIYRIIYYANCIFCFPMEPFGAIIQIVLTLIGYNLVHSLASYICLLLNLTLTQCSWLIIDMVIM